MKINVVWSSWWHTAARTRRMHTLCSATLASALLLASCNKEIISEISPPPLNDIEPEFGVLTTTGHYTMATYNVRRITSSDTGNKSWTVRRPLVKKIILDKGFDLLGVQKPLGTQIDHMKADLTPHGYANFGVSDHGDHAYQHQDIFYKTSKFNLLGTGRFWLAPGAPTSVPSNPTPWDSYYHTSVVTWGRFQDKATGQIFYVFNAHFNPGNPNGGTPKAEDARKQSALLMLSKIPEIAGDAPVIFMGDLNSNQMTEVYSLLNGSSLLEETFELASEKVPTSRQTGNWWNPTPTGNSQIDHIFVTNHWQVAKRLVHWDTYNGGILPSDHFPVSADIRLPVPTTLTATEDAFIQDGEYAETNFGSVGLVVKSGLKAGYSRRACLKFDLNGITSVSQAILRVYGSNTESTATVSINVQSANDNWTEHTVTWNNPPSGGRYLKTANINSTARYYDWDVTSFVKSEAAGDGIASFILYQAHEANLYTSWNSREASTNKPVLVITP